MRTTGQVRSRQSGVHRWLTSIEFWIVAFGNGGPQMIRNTLVVMRTGLTCLLLSLSTAASAQWIGRPAPAWENEFQAWVADVHKHVYPNSFGRDLQNRKIEL